MTHSRNLALNVNAFFPPKNQLSHFYDTYFLWFLRTNYILNLLL